MKLSGDTSAITAPGQFVNIRLDGLFLRRPISVCDWDDGTLTIVYKVVGKGTEAMRRMKAGTLDILTGLGNGYDMTLSGSKPVLLGGGVGVPPLYGLARRLRTQGKDVSVVLGFNTASEIFYEEAFQLEIASTQDKIIRKAIVEKVAPLMDSLGINERETIDVLEIIGEESLAEQCRRQTTSENLFAGLVKIKEKTGVARIQLHMFGLYITRQDKSFRITPEADLRGMMTAATIAAAKAGTGNIDNLLWAQGREVSDVGLIEADSLAWATGQNDLAQTGIGRFRNWDLIVAPTILIEKPLTLVGMGDTISSLSLVGAL